jgi:hypothetical protein
MLDWTIECHVGFLPRSLRLRSLSDCAVNSHCPTTIQPTMSMLDKFRKGAQKAGMQAGAFVSAGSAQVATGSRGFVQGFSLPGEAEKAAKILESFLGEGFTLLTLLDGY